ncbi:STARD3 N-terminal-like protein isoform X7 [Apteryx rowi]|uniref:STARD3 N-terminal-like protein isoform X7 n=1 Tax=Apteryx rowi TaxID=308060 RepID=UPI000E1CCC87|nr:STARD3 N-terminal-like protein isoform X7 [Apteryx rowi]
MNRVPDDAENAHSSSVESCPSLRDVHSINPAQLMARIESYEGREKKGISDVRRTFCLFVTFDLLFVTLLWIIELNVKGGIETTLEKEVLQYDYSSSYFDIFLFSQGAFGYVLPIISFILAWIETWFLDFKVLPQEAEEENSKLLLFPSVTAVGYIQLHTTWQKNASFSYSRTLKSCGKIIHMVYFFFFLKGMCMPSKKWSFNLFSKAKLKVTRARSVICQALRSISDFVWLRHENLTGLGL